MSAEVAIPGNSGRFPDRISAHVPKGLRQQARLAAQQRGLTLAEFVRRVIADSLTDASHASLDGKGR